MRFGLCALAKGLELAHVLRCSHQSCTTFVKKCVFHIIITFHLKKQMKNNHNITISEFGSFPILSEVIKYHNSKIKNFSNFYKTEKLNIIISFKKIFEYNQRLHLSY
jgi:hypothetical protein